MSYTVLSNNCDTHFLRERKSDGLSQWVIRLSMMILIMEPRCHILAQCVLLTTTFSTIVFSEHKAIVLLDFELKNLGTLLVLHIPFFNCNIYAMPL